MPSSYASAVKTASSAVEVKVASPSAVKVNAATTKNQHTIARTSILHQHTKGKRCYSQANQILFDAPPSSTTKKKEITKDHLLMLCKICKDYGEAGFEWSDYKLKEIRKKPIEKSLQ